MTNSNQTSATDSSQGQSKAKPERFHWKSGITILALAISSTIAANRLAPDDTSRMIRTFYGIGVGYLAMMVWWLVFSGFRLRTRLVTLVMVTVLGAGTMVLSVKKVTFEGDMRPHFRFIWDPPSQSEQSQEWLAEYAPSHASPVEDSVIIEVTNADWPHYCGSNGDRVIDEPVCSFDWKTNPPKELWRHPVGDAWSSFAVVGTRLFTQEQRGPMECVVCYDADSGLELWRREDAARYDTAQGATGPRATPTVTGEAVFSLGASGILCALNPISGSLLWQRNICTDAGSDMVEWGMSGSPLIYDQTVIVDAGGKQNKAVIAYDRKSGDVVWASCSHKAGYTSPRLEHIGDSLQLLIFHGDGLAGLEPATGKKLWEYPWTNQYKINVAQPMRFGTEIFISSGYDSGCVMLDPVTLSDGKPREVWPPNKNLKLKFNEAVKVGDHVYGLDDGILACVNVRTGERTWKGGRYRYGQILLWAEKLIVQAEAGYVAVVEARPERFTEVARLNALNDRTWNVPVVNRGRLYVRNAAEAACYQLPMATP